MITLDTRTLVAVAAVVTLSGAAQASRELELATQLIRELEADIPKLESGDLRAGQAASDKYGRAYTAYNSVPKVEQSTAAFVDAYKRIVVLPPKLGGFLQAEARKELEEVARAAAAVKPRDPQANVLIDQNNEAGKWVKAAANVLGPTPELKELNQLYQANYALLSARFEDREPGAPAAAPPADGLDLDERITDSLNSIEHKYWKDFASRYAEYLAALRRGDLNRSDINQVSGMADAIGNRKAVAHTKEKIAAFNARRNAMIDEHNKKVAAQAAQDKQDGAEIDKKINELAEFLGGFDSQGRLRFDGHFKEPINARSAKEWVQKIQDWRELQAKGANMMKQIKIDYPRFADNRSIRDLEEFFAAQMAAGIEEAIDGCTKKFNLTAPYKADNCECLPTGRFNSGPCTDFAKTLCTNDMKKARDAVSALEVIYRDLLKQKVPDNVAKYGAAMDARAMASQQASAAAYEAARMPKGTTASADKAKSIILGRYPKADILRLVVTYGPARESAQRTSTSSAGAPAGYVFVRKYTVNYSQMQATAAERVGNDIRMVWYDMYDDGNGWYVGSRNPGARIKPEHVDK